MLPVKVDLIPHGDEDRRSTLTDVYIGNDGSGSPVIGNYDVYVDHDPREHPFVHERSERPGWLHRMIGVSRRDPGHRLWVAATALLLAAEAATESEREAVGT